MKKLNWGILGTAKIARVHVIPAMQKSEICDVYTLASRSIESSQEICVEHGIKLAYGSYRDMLKDPNIVAVYNPLPNHLHVPWTIMALQEGKHVLCEKPFALNADELTRIMDFAKHCPEVKVMEAFMYRFHKQWLKVYEMVRSGKIGELRSIQSYFSYYHDDFSNIRYQQEFGGGGLLDIGCYPVSLSRWLFQSEPKRVIASMDIHPKTHTDTLVSGILEFENGISTFTCGTLLEREQKVLIVGTEGSLELKVPFNPSVDQETEVFFTHKSHTEVIKIPACDQYQAQIEAFSQCILDNSDVPISLEDSFHNMLVLDRLALSVKENRWVS